MDKHLRVGSFRFDKFVSIVGGLRLQEPAGDVAIAMVSGLQMDECILAA